MLKLTIESASDLSALKKQDKSGDGNDKREMDSVVIVKFSGAELGRTPLYGESNNPQYSFKEWANPSLLKVDVGHALLRSRELENCRPFYFEHLDVEVYEVDVASNRTSTKAGFNSFVGNSSVNMTKIGECRIYLNKTGVQTYRIVSTIRKNEDGHSPLDIARFASLTVILAYDDAALATIGGSEDKIANTELSSLFNPHKPQYQQLYINFNDISPSSVIGLTNFPGPSAGETVQETHDGLIWSVTTHTNAFGDSSLFSVAGSLVVTDLRLLFIPHSIATPTDSVFCNSSTINIDGSRGDLFSEGNIGLLRRLTIQIPIPSIDEIISTPAPATISSSDPRMVDDLDNMNLQITLREGSDFFFLVKRSSYSPKHKRTSMLNIDSIGRAMTPSSAILNATAGQNVSERRSANTSSTKYRAGLMTDDISPKVWCARVIDRVMYMIREDIVWVKWMQHLKTSVVKDLPMVDLNEWTKENDRYENWENDFIRQRVQDASWMISDVNTTYEMCPTYPQALVMPSILSDEDIREAASERSKGRLSALVWVHPDNKAALCRAAQPHYGMKVPKADRKLLIAMKSVATNGLPVRIADARPKLNANANAIQGKGFENISHLGGAKNASLIFLDIENIHIVRDSFKKMKSGFVCSPSSEDDSVSKSGWLTHISLILKGAVAIAESLIIGHPVLVHCSDGWDRTAQLAALAEILLDPYYRTIKGFLILLNKEFCAFGHQFEMRLGSYSSKESSQILVQFLDSVWQIVTQRPLEFEYTPYMLQVILQCAYSGLFLSFRGNCDRDRNRLLRAAKTAFLSNVSLHQSVSNFSSMFLYISILLKSPVYAALLVNPQYKPLNAINSSSKSQFALSYFRPRFGLNDLKLWREGALCYFPDAASYLNGSSSSLPHEKAAMAYLQMNNHLLAKPSVNVSSRHGGDGVNRRLKSDGTVTSKNNLGHAFESSTMFDKLDCVDNLTPHVFSEVLNNSGEVSGKANKANRGGVYFRNLKRCALWLFLDADCKHLYAFTVIALYSRAIKLRNEALANLISKSASSEYLNIFEKLEHTSPSAWKALKKMLLVLTFRRLLLNYFAELTSKKVLFDSCRSVVYDIVDCASQQGIMRSQAGSFGVDVAFVYKTTMQQLNEVGILGLPVGGGSFRDSTNLFRESVTSPSKDVVIGFESIYGSSPSFGSGGGGGQEKKQEPASPSSSFGSFLMKGLGLGSK